MEEKKELNEEKTEEVTGGRLLSAEKFSGLDPAKKEEYLRTAKKLDLKSGNIPEEILTKISGGDDGEGCLVEIDQNCPMCGGWMHGYVVDTEYGKVFEYYICKYCGFWY